MALPQELRSLVNKSVSILGQVIHRELGEKKFRFIENLRVGMTEIREVSPTSGFTILQSHLDDLKKLKSKELHEIAHSFTLMLELMNSCENAYRSHRLNKKNRSALPKTEAPEAIVYVLTAHPTEARSPQNIAIFHQIQNLLIEVLDRNFSADEFLFSTNENSDLLHLLEIAWRTPIVRSRSPKVKDEAEHIYSLLFRDEVLFSLIEKNDRHVPFYVRSWVGGDKDGHPGVNEKTLIESLSLSRKNLLRVISNELSLIRKSLQLFPSAPLQKRIAGLEKMLRQLQNLRSGDSKPLQKFKILLAGLKIDYHKTLGSIHPSLNRITQIVRTFPALVVPLELRESSDVLMKPAKERPRLAIYKMLAAIERISRGADPRWYARGFIISMTESIEHIRAAARFQKEVFGFIPLPVIPLFEEASSLADADQIVEQILKDPELKKAALTNWDGMMEMMVGYSDSAKEAGVLASRLAISKALPSLERICEKNGIKPVFFHGSGGSIDRGGGSIEDQTAWWPKSALKLYKVTIQGEMVERSLASPAIAKRQIETIIESVSKSFHRVGSMNASLAVDAFAKNISESYRKSITSPDFLKLVETATPYSYLKVLKIGSRPSKRAAQLTVKALRAIPWILCWTQTRVLFPTWWGVGTAWKNSSDAQKSDLKLAFKKDPVFTSYIKALGFTIAKVELNIWKMYLQESGMDSGFAAFEAEFELAKKAYFEICEHKELMWFRPWLGESILLRSPMIHPLNLLQILAKQRKDLHLLRVTVTGISSGMMTTG